ncbi:MAG: DUF2339 domain-containing protein [Desulfobacteraceae bacterium]|nr:MAG: DUF2339 domain-containing protein [Desulfobacteraceae bacterium]
MNPTLYSLKKDLDQLKSDFSKRAYELERRIRLLEREQDHKKRPEPPLDPPPLEPDHIDPDLEGSITEKWVTVPVAPTEQPADAQTVLQLEENQGTGPVTPVDQKEAGKTILTGLFEHLLPVLGPFTGLLGKLVKAYRHYHSQGKAPVFFMTIAGILALVTGMGYLLQYSFSAFLGPVGKVSFGFISAVLIIMCGIIISRKRPEMDDYASSLIGLGVIISYLCAYFTGPFYHLLPDIGTFGLLVILTGAAYGLAVAFQTRVVAVISLLGGALAPLLMAGAVQSPQVYLAYILILAAAMLVLSHQIQWSTLAHLNMAVSFIVIESTVMALPSFGPTPVILLLIFHLFYYLFFGFTGLQVLHQASLTRVSAVLFSSNLFFFLILVPQVVFRGKVIGGIYLLNAVLAALIFPIIPALMKRAGSEQKSREILQMICILSAGLFTGLGILSLTMPELLGLVWGVEALLLMYLANRYRMFQVRVESYVILVLSLFFSLYYGVSWVLDSMAPVPQIIQLSWDHGWINLVFASAVLGAFVFLMERSKSMLRPVEEKGMILGNEMLSVILSLVFLTTVGLFWTAGIWLLAVVPMIALVYRSKVCKLWFTEYFAHAHLILLFIPMVISAMTVESLYFSEQVLIGKIARAEAFFCLLLIAEFYRRLHPDSRLRAFTEGLRHTFYLLIPLSLLPWVWHWHVKFFPMAVWGAAGICLVLYRIFQYKSLCVELYGLVISASLVSILACAWVEFFRWDGYAFQGLTAGLVFYAAVMFLWKGWEKTPAGTPPFIQIRGALSRVFTLAFYYLGIFCFILAYAVNGSAALALVLMTGYFLLIYTLAPGVGPLVQNHRVLFSIIALCAAGLITTHLAGVLGLHYMSAKGFTWLHRLGLYNILILGMYGMILFQKRPHFREAMEKLGGGYLHFWVFHILAGFTYVITLGRVFNQGFGPALSVGLVLHATVVLFLTLKERFQKLIYLAVILYGTAALKVILFDLNDFSLVQKMIAFIIIGVLLLAGAYQYQRMKGRILNPG